MSVFVLAPLLDMSAVIILMSCLHSGTPRCAATRGQNTGGEWILKKLSVQVLITLMCCVAFSSIQLRKTTRYSTQSARLLLTGGTKNDPPSFAGRRVEIKKKIPRDLVKLEFNCFVLVITEKPKCCCLDPEPCQTYTVISIFPVTEIQQFFFFKCCLLLDLFQPKFPSFLEGHMGFCCVTHFISWCRRQHIKCLCDGRKIQIIVNIK